MDKYDIVLDMVEHTDRYSNEELTELLSDPETARIYNILSATGSILTACDEPDVDVEWKRFSSGRFQKRPSLRVASIVSITIISLAAVALSILTKSDIFTSKETLTPEETSETAGYADEAIYSEPSDSLTTIERPVLFENESLSTIMQTISEHYGVEIIFNSPDVSDLRLFYRFNPSISLDEVIEQLNTFEQINIHRDGITLIVD